MILCPFGKLEKDEVSPRTSTSNLFSTESRENPTTNIPGYFFPLYIYKTLFLQQIYILKMSQTIDIIIF